MHQTPVLIQAQELAQNLAGPQPAIVLDCRFALADPQWGQQQYALGAIPRAHYAHLEHDLSSAKTSSSGRHPLPEEHQWNLCLARWGITAEAHVVVYDDKTSAMAARAWWLLRASGVTKVQVLDGGLNAWQSANLELQPGQMPLSAAPSQPALTYSTAWQLPTVKAEKLLQQLKQIHVLDARSPDRFRGENETIDPVAGHIPGAINRFFMQNLQDDGRFKSPQQLQHEFSAQGISAKTAEHVIHQCGSGVTACHNLLALAYAQWPMGALYPGSWSEWCSNPQRPMATGQAQANTFHF